MRFDIDRGNGGRIGAIINGASANVLPTHGRFYSVTFSARLSRPAVAFYNAGNTRGRSNEAGNFSAEINPFAYSRPACRNRYLARSSLS